MSAARTVAFLAVLAVVPTLARGQAPVGELPGLPGEGRVIWNVAGLERGPLRLVKTSYLLVKTGPGPDTPVVGFVLELTRRLDTDQTLFLAGYYDPEAAKRGPVGVTLRDRDGVPLRTLTGQYQGFPTSPRPGDRFRMILPIPRELWDRAASIDLDWAAPLPVLPPSEVDAAGRLVR